MAARLAPIVLLAVLACLPIASRGDVILTATGGLVSAGGGRSVIPVVIATDSNDQLGQFTIAFDIVPNGSNAIVPVASLEFVGPASYLTDPTLTSTAYLYNASNPALPGPGSFKFNSQDVFGVDSDPSSSGFNTRFVGADIYDGTASSGDVALSTGGYLIANLIVTYSAGATTNGGGDAFDIVLDVTSSWFQDGTGNYLDLSATTADSPILATVRVVPEPGAFSLTVTGIAALSAMLLSRRRFRTGRAV